MSTHPTAVAEPRLDRSNLGYAVSPSSFTIFVTCFLTVSLGLTGPALFAQATSRDELPLKTGKEIYHTACAACHGSDGKGSPRTTVGFDTPLPDFTDCNFTVREADQDWISVVHSGGPARGFSEIMPSFAEALTGEQIAEVVGYLRGFCQERVYPRGELNLPRALITEKAFPEDEYLVTTSINTTGAPGLTNRIVYEKRFGPRNQIELVLPLRLGRQSPGAWHGGVGDLALGYKRLLVHSPRTGSILSAAGELVLPTGDRRRGFGNGATVLEAFGLFGQLLPGDSFLQFQGGTRQPTHLDEVRRSAFWRTALGKNFFQEQGRGRAWVPMVELLADRFFQPGASTNWDVLPQMHVTLSRRQHVMFNVGYRIPMTNTTGRSKQLVFYLIWDFFDGGLRDGW